MYEFWKILFNSEEFVGGEQAKTRLWFRFYTNNTKIEINSPAVLLTYIVSNTLLMVYSLASILIQVFDCWTVNIRYCFCRFIYYLSVLYIAPQCIENFISEFLKDSPIARSLLKSTNHTPFVVFKIMCRISKLKIIDHLFLPQTTIL
jgi:hypothetical protein